MSALCRVALHAYFAGLGMRTSRLGDEIPLTEIGRARNGTVEPVVSTSNVGRTSDELADTWTHVHDPQP